MKPIVFDLFCGLGGWSEGFLKNGYRAIGFDIEAHDYGSGGYPGELVLRDIRSLNGADLVKEFGMPTCIVASPPCQEFSYMAMPWSKAKEKLKKIQADPAEQIRLTSLFNECFRIQREVSSAAQRYVPTVVENVRGAQKWVGRSRWNFGSFHLWGDVPALMPLQWKGLKQPGNCAARRFDERPVPRWGDEGYKGFSAILGESAISRRYGSKSQKRKEASALIAKIPPVLSDWIARVYKPKCQVREPQI